MPSKLWALVPTKGEIQPETLSQALSSAASLVDMYSLDQYYYWAPGWTENFAPLLLSASIALDSEFEILLFFHCSNFWSPVLLLVQPWLFFAWGISSSSSALHIYTTADTNHSQGGKNVPHTPQLKAGMQNSAALNWACCWEDNSYSHMYYRIRSRWTGHKIRETPSCKDFAI